jgi:hypothetical protein
VLPTAAPPAFHPGTTHSSSSFAGFQPGAAFETFAGTVDVAGALAFDGLRFMNLRPSVPEERPDLGGMLGEDKRS